MTTIINLASYNDGTINIPLAPPTAIGGWSITFEQTKRLGGNPIYTLYVSSGRNGVSGLQVVNSGQGIIVATIPALAVSGLDPGTYTFTMRRTDSGSQTILATGTRIM